MSNNKKINLNLDSNLLTKLKIVSFINNEKISNTINTFLSQKLEEYEKNNKSINLNQFTKT
tara:strand:- start:417 stop:599 length:183 start_codon:yes stop_codon:yes gene_type:complete